ncbi:MAG: response regulator [Burkholderiaceae bacterium]|nr:response regulator [Burkholderiaceae bacterium]
MHHKNADLGIAERCEWAARLVSLAVAALGLMVLAGWAVDSVTLKSVAPGLASMKANTAMAFLLAGASLFCACRRQPATPVWRVMHLALAAPVGLLGLLTLGEYAFAADWGIDQLLFRDAAEPASRNLPGRMAQASAAGFALAALALCTLELRRTCMISMVAALAGGLVGLLVLLGYAYGIEALYGVGAYSSVALHTALGLVALNLGVLLARPRRGLMVIVTGNTAGGVMARRLLPLALLAPFLIGWLRIEGERRGWVSSGFGVTLVALTYAILFSAFILRTGALLARRDRARQALDAQRQMLEIALVAHAQALEQALDLSRQTAAALAEKSRQLEVSSALFKTVYDTAPVGLCFIGPDFRFLMINEHLASINGKPVAEHIGHTLREVLGEFGASVEQIYRRVFDSGRPLLNLELSGTTAADPRRTGHWLASYHPVFANDGRIVGVNGVVIDVSARKQDELALACHRGDLEAKVIERTAELSKAEAEQRRLNRALRLLSDGNMAVLRAKDERQLLDELCQMIVLSGGYVMGWVGVPEQDAAKSVRPVAQAGAEDGYLDSVRISWDGARDVGCGPTGTAIRAGATQINQNCLTNARMAPWRAAALLRGYQASAALPLVIENRVFGALTIYSADPQAFGMAEMKLLEELAGNMTYGITSLRLRGELERHQQRLEELVAERTRQIAALNAELVERVAEAESANRAKSAFLAAMSHEIRTPLSAVIGLTELLSHSPLNRGQRDYADKIELSAQTLRILIDDILDFSKIEAGALQLERAPFSLSAILGTTAAVVSVSLRDKPIEAVFDVEPGLPDALVGDAMRLQQILLNLAINAVKFTACGELVVAVRCLARDCASATLQFSVRDTGIGIPADQLEQIFKVFAQADMSTSRRYGGTGLGLAISARLAALMNGQILVDSVVGHGSEFRFSVPLALAEGATPVLEECLSELRILIVDDHPLARNILRQSCASFGWRATVLDSGPAALAELRRGGAAGLDYDIMLLDWRMPGMDGIAMIRQAHRAEIDLPLVVLMAATFELEQAAAASDDFHLDGILAKPVTPASLLEAVRQARSGRFNALLPRAEKTDRRLAGMRLLVAEDNAINQHVIEQILTRAGAEVRIVDSGLAAIEVLESPGERFDALLMDIQMPVMDGYTATRIIREEMCLLELPIIAVTAYAMAEDREQSRRAGMAGHIVKPIDVGDLLDILLPGQGEAGPPPAEPGRQWAMAASAFTLPGVDVGAALAIFDADREKYLALLRGFVAGHADDIDEARRRFGAADASGAAQLVHGLRGMAGFLQASRLAGLGARAAGALRDGDAQAVLASFDELQGAMRELRESIAELDAAQAR